MRHLLWTVEMFHSQRVLRIIFEVFWMSFNPLCSLTIFTKFYDPGLVAKSRNWCVYNNSYEPAMHHISLTVEIFAWPRVLLIMFEVFWMRFNTFSFLTTFTKFHDPGTVTNSRNLCVYNKSYAPAMHHLRGQLRTFAPQGCFWSYSKCSEWVSTPFVFSISGNIGLKRTSHLEHLMCVLINICDRIWENRPYGDFAWMEILSKIHWIFTFWRNWVKFTGVNFHPLATCWWHSERCSFILRATRSVCIKSLVAPVLRNTDVINTR